MIAKGTAETAEEELAALRAEVEKLRKLQPPDLAKLYKDIRRLWFRFITDRVNPGHQARHHGDLTSWRPDLFQEAGQLGLQGLGAPKEMGGDGLDPISTGIALEELAKLCEDPGFLIIMVAAKKCAKVLAATGRDDLVETFAKPMLKGDMVAGWASWEPGDSQFLKTEAVPLGGDKGWEITGTKPFVTAGVYAKAIVISAREKESGEVMLFVVRPEDPGVKMTPFGTVGGRHLGYASLSLQGVKVKQDRMVVDTDADAIIAAAFDEEVRDICAIHLGWMQRMFGLAIDSLRDKVRGGMAFLSIPHIQGQVGRLQIGIEVARGMFLRVLEHYRLGKNDPITEPLTVALKYFVTERTLDTAQTLMQLQGSQAYLDDNPWGRYLTHVMCLLHAAGTQDLMPQQLGERYLAELELRKLRKFTM